ncbi:Eukaryotic translation initiation factor 4E-4 [Tritrichomonas foetus]|uniref:Eukaryotic translation initiation factor 4E-4 n=1 Tax=Tritrichomonas foetus TaxID=1144522 RepID=A0A1J4K441_9EUKA|nr:Eukaryotic translation initiation factor 4E-4 [Tritrichomonas foetus]|eukprot:OHT05608.1 Eukaryotic translation initiation factor 4E-4 [Tritrichomonas foetus]
MQLTTETALVKLIDRIKNSYGKFENRPTWPHQKKMTHQLQSEWSFYGFTSAEDDAQDSDYAAQIKLLARFSTIEDFWRIYSHIIRPSVLPAKSAIHLFRGKSRAMREDPEHINGGSFLIRISKGLAPYYWEQLILALIGERFSPDVIGVIISSRAKFFNLHLWHQTATDADLRLKICKDFCDFLHLPKGIRIDYTAHNTVIHIADNGKQTIHYILQDEGPVDKILPTKNQAPSENQNKEEETKNEEPTGQEK